MELKVWVEGIQRIVCGVTEATTCQDVVFALAHATGKSGRFTLIERWRNNERQLSPNENPMKILLKWGEYSNDVQFILQRNESSKQIQKPKSTNSSISGNSTGNSSIESPEKHKDVQKSHTFSGCHVTNAENIGVVKGIQQVKTVPLEVRETHSASPRGSPKKGGSYCGSDVSDSSRGPPLKGPLAPPPYRDPPPPSSAVHHDKFKQNILQESNKSQRDWEDNNRNKMNENSLHNAQYRELIALINYQREKLSNQQADLTKYDAEIVFWESKDREKQLQLDFIAQELIAVANTHKANQEQIQALSYVEEENEIVRQQEKTLKSEITLLRSKLANCETELLQCKNKIRLLMDELQMEQKVQNRRCESKKQVEKSLLVEVERLQKDIELAKQSTELHHLTAETLKKEVAALETAIIEKKRQVEQLVQEMKEANLQSLSAAARPGGTAAPDEGRGAGGAAGGRAPPRAVPPRRMVGSPRQLENAAPTSKNPHGVWV